MMVLDFEALKQIGRRLAQCPALTPNAEGVDANDTSD